MTLTSATAFPSIIPNDTIASPSCYLIQKFRMNLQPAGRMAPKLLWNTPSSCLNKYISISTFYKYNDLKLFVNS